MQVSVVHFSTNPVNTSNSMPNNGRSGRSTSKNNAANNSTSNNAYANYAYGDKAYRLEDVAIKYVDKFHNFVIVTDNPVIPNWKEAGEFVAVNNYGIGPKTVLGKLYQVDGFADWWEAAKVNASVDAANAATKNFINSVKGVDDLGAEAMEAVLHFNMGVMKPNCTDTLYRKLGKNISINGVLLPITADEDYTYADGTVSDRNLGKDGYRIICDIEVKLSDELLAEIKK